MKNEKFQQFSAQERTYLSRLAEKLRVQFTPSSAQGRCPYDGVFVKSESECVSVSVVEAKVRQMSVGTYDEYVIEKQKYEKLMDLHAAGRCQKVLYVNFFRDDNGPDVCLIWSLHKLDEPTWTEMSMNAQTAVSNRKKKKTVGLLGVSKAIRVEL